MFKIGRKVRVLTIVDIFSRFSPALEPRLIFRGTDVHSLADAQKSGGLAQILQ
jgi:hypothetical protein